MKAMNKLFVAAVIAISLAACQQETFEGRQDSGNFYASVETFATGTKTALGENRSVVWSSEDRIAIFEGKDVGQAYQVLDSYVGKSSGEFAEVEGLVAEGTGDAIDGIVAVYPFNDDLTVTSEDYGDYIIEGITFPSEQKYVAGSFSDEAFPMVAVTSDKNLSFKNVGGVLKLSIKGSYSVSSITLTGNSGESLSGSVTVTLGSNGIPSVTMSDDASTSVSLVCDPAVQLNPETATDFYISIPPTEFEVGFKVTILDGESKKHGLATHKTNPAERSSILAMPESTPESLDDIERTADTFCSVDFIEGWTETRFGGDGTIVFVKEDEQGRMTNSLMFLPNKENILMPVYIRFDENEIPSYMSFMDTEIYIDGYTDSTVDFTLAVEDAVWSIKDVPCDELMPYSLQTKAWSDNNAIRNACAIGNLIVGAAGVAGGVVMISASGIGAAITGGTSTPISVAGIALGIMSIKGGCDSIAGSLETIFGPAKQEQSTYVKDGLMGIGMEKVSDAIENAPKNDFIKSKLPQFILKDPADLGKLGTISYWSGFMFSSIDEEWGQTYTGLVNLAQVHQEVKVVTGRADNITKDSAELYGYVSPLATAPFGDKILTEIYIVLWKAGDENNKKHHSIFNSDGGIVSFTFIHLEPDTEYCYQTIFEDLDNKKYRFGEIETFKTFGNPTCETGDASSITTMSAVVECTYSNVSEDGQCQVLVSWDDGHKIVKAENREGTQSITLSSLKPNTTYSYCASIDYDGGPVNGEMKEFKTKGEPDCITGNASNITTNSAVVDCSYSNVPEDGQCQVMLSWDDGHRVIKAENREGTQSITLSSLKPNTTYSYCASIDYEEGPVNGEMKEFTTKEDECTLALREQLIKLYNDTDGDNWTNNENWCSDKPIEEWYGISQEGYDEEGDKIIGINLTENNLVGKINLANCNSISYLYCRTNQLTSLDVSGFTKLGSLDCSDNQITNIDVSYCSVLGNIFFDNNPLISLNASKCKGLHILYGGNLRLTSLDVSGCASLEELHCNDNQLTSLELSGCTSLKRLFCANNQLKSLDLKDCSYLEVLTCSQNQIETLDLAGYTHLKGLAFESDVIMNVTASGCTALNGLLYVNNSPQLTFLDLSGCISLERIDCTHCPQLTHLNISGCTLLKEFSSSMTHQLTELDFTGCFSLEEVDCMDCQLTSLNFSGYKRLKDLRCSNNQLTSLDVSGCSALENLWCYNNQLTSLDITGCTSIKYISCRDNKICQMITSEFEALDKNGGFDYDYRYTDYAHKYKDIDGNSVCELVYKDNGIGWWYPGEPESKHKEWH